MKKFLFSALGAAVTLSAVYANKVTIVVSDFQFTPDLVNLQLGDTVVFQWSSGLHTATSTDIPDGAVSFDETLSDEINEFVYVPAVSGTYNYVCTPHIAMNMVGSFVVEEHTGISGPSADAMVLSLWPNPVNEILNLSLAPGVDIRSTIDVYNMAGQRVFHTTASGGKVVQLTVGHLPAGVYAIRLATEHSVAKRLFVIR